MDLSKKLQLVSKEVYIQHEEYIKKNFLDRTHFKINSGIEVYRDIISRHAVLVKVIKNNNSIEYYSRIYLNEKNHDR